MNGLYFAKGNNSYFYPGASLSFIFSDAFDISKNILSYGKVRVGLQKQVEMLIHIELIIHLKG